MKDFRATTPLPEMHTIESPQVAENFGSVAHLEREWDEAVMRLDGTIYMTFGWLRTWWEFYGAGRTLRLFIFRQDGAICALLPFYLDKLPLPTLGLRIARLVGASLPPKTFDPPVDPTCAARVFSACLKHLFDVDRCDLVSLGPVSALWNGDAALRELRQDSTGPASLTTIESCDVRTLFRLPETFDAYLSSLDPSERKSRMKRMRQLERQATITEEVISDPTLVGSEFEKFVELHTSQWHAIGKGGHFHAWPAALEYNRAQVAEQARHGRVHFFRLLADGQPIAVRYTYALGSTLYSELPARATGQPWDKLGVGVSSLIRFKGQAIAAGFRVVDSGLGAYDHKSGAGGDEVAVSVVRITRSSWSSRLQVAWGLAMARLIRIVCQKIWYRRIVPRLPRGISRTQSLSWLRFDF